MNESADGQNRIKCFGYIADETSRMLILGSMPSVKSLEKQQYYAHPQNRFWRVIFALANETFSDDYALRVAALRKIGVALWDTVGSCERVGSMDGAIKNAAPNDIRALLKKYPDIKRVGANGGKSGEMLKKFFPEINFVRLPSTSPANAAVSLSELIKAYGEFVFGEK